MGETDSPFRPLRILAVINLPWDARLGAARVWIELTKEWLRDGHTVEKFCLTDAFPQTAVSGAGSALRQAFFPGKAAAYVRQKAAHFDVIDGLIGVLPYSKRSLRFSNLLVARSVGLYRLYDHFLRESRLLWPEQAKGRWFGSIFHAFIERRAWKDSERSIRSCDLLNVPNDNERLELEKQPGVRARTIVQPYGLNDDFRDALGKAAASASQRLRRKKICFIGMWGPRKGSRDWPKIVAVLRQRHPEAQFLFLGTMFDESVVRGDLGPVEGISCRTTFAEAELPGLLADCALALFPSYIEGFGLVVLEQLAAGLPTVAYDVPGPRQVLQRQGARLLCPVGDTMSLAARASDILDLPPPEYEKLSTECMAIAADYRWSEIARATITQYHEALESLGQARARLA